MPVESLWCPFMKGLGGVQEPKGKRSKRKTLWFECACRHLDTFTQNSACPGLFAQLQRHFMCVVTAGDQKNEESDVAILHA